MVAPTSSQLWYMAQVQPLTKLTNLLLRPLLVLLQKLENKIDLNLKQSQEYPLKAANIASNQTYLTC